MSLPRTKTTRPRADIVLLLLLKLAIGAFGARDARASADTEESAAYRYSGAPWPLRYFIYVDEAGLMKRFRLKMAEMNANRERGTENAVYRGFEEFFPPDAAIATSTKHIGITTLIFSRSGTLLSPEFHRFHFTAARTDLNNLVLLKNGIGNSREKPYHFAYWWELPGKHIMSPAVCDITDDFRYVTDNPKSKGYIGGFGCREWSAQLQDDERPYIDVTSYLEDGLHIISDFVGWSGFEHKLKPVIGKHLTEWICLHECPGGEDPGVIKSMEAWTRKHGFPMPKQPPRQPEFPDSLFPNIYLE
jgi:hypothetical protein